MSKPGPTRREVMAAFAAATVGGIAAWGSKEKPLAGPLEAVGTANIGHFRIGAARGLKVRVGGKEFLMPIYEGEP